jgi:hypothetical protein
VQARAKRPLRELLARAWLTHWLTGRLSQCPRMRDPCEQEQALELALLLLSGLAVRVPIDELVDQTARTKRLTSPFSDARY